METQNQKQKQVHKTDEIYIYEDVEVVLTGRLATRNKKGTANKRRQTTNVMETKVEITPASKMTGSWKKWVVKDSLFVVQAA